VIKGNLVLYFAEQINGVFLTKFRTIEVLQSDWGVISDVQFQPLENIHHDNDVAGAKQGKAKERDKRSSLLLPLTISGRVEREIMIPTSTNLSFIWFKLLCAEKPINC
jgi:hypothetical protein